MYRDPVQSLEAPSLQSPTAAMRPLRVGMIGIGTVGAGTFRVLARNQALIAGRAGRDIKLVVVCARSLARAMSVVGKDVALTNDPMQVATHPDVDVLVEAAGGTGPARDWVLAAIRAGKHVVTANKALLATHGNEIFAEALAQAQALGYAEADPTFDIEGIDAAHKISLLAANAFGMPVRFADAQVEGITRLQGLDVACAEQLGFRIKLLGVAKRRKEGDSEGNVEGVELRVQPALVPATHLLAHVNGSMNAVMVKGDASGVTMYYGAGAGSEQTASAVIADLVDVERLDGTHAAQRVPHLGFHPQAVDEQLAVLPRAAVHTRHYLRVPVHSAQQIEAVGAWLAAQHVPVLQVALAHDKALPPGSGPQVLVLTDAVAQSTVDLAVFALAAHPAVAGPAVTLRVETLEG